MPADYRTQIAKAGFHASPQTKDLCKTVQQAYGFRYYYEPLRMFLARSLMEPDAPAVATLSPSKDLTIRGEQLFGAGDVDVWISLLTEAMASDGAPRVRDLRTAVEAHIARGAILFKQLATEAHWEPAAMVDAMGSFLSRQDSSHYTETPVDAVPIQVRLGDIKDGTDVGPALVHVVGAADEQPHILVVGQNTANRANYMAGVALHLMAQSPAPMLALSNQPRFRDRLATPALGQSNSPHAITVVDFIQQPLPLDLFAEARHGAVAIRHLVDRVAHAMERAFSEFRFKQVGAWLREHMTAELGAGQVVSLASVARAFVIAFEDNRRLQPTRQAMQTLIPLHDSDDLQQPATFFSKSWQLDLSGLPSDSHRKLVSLLMVDALTAHLESRPRQPETGVRVPSQLVFFDSAEPLFEEANHRGFDELMGMGWSRGVMMMLGVSGPGELQRQPRERARDFGAAVSFACHARRGMRLFGDLYGRKLLQDEFSRDELPSGIALARAGLQPAAKIVPSALV